MKKILLVMFALIALSCSRLENELENAIFKQLSKDYTITKENPMGAINLKINKEWEVGPYRYYDCTFDLVRKDKDGYLYPTMAKALISRSRHDVYEVSYKIYELDL